MDERSICDKESSNDQPVRIYSLLLKCKLEVNKMNKFHKMKFHILRSISKYAANNELKSRDYQINAIAISEDCSSIFSGSCDGKIRVWDFPTGECIRVLDGHSNYVCCIVISRDDSKLVSGSRDWSLRIWEITTYECIRVLEGHTHSVFALAISADDKSIVSGSADKSLRIWFALK